MAEMKEFDALIKIFFSKCTKPDNLEKKPSEIESDINGSIMGFDKECFLCCGKPKRACEGCHNMLYCEDHLIFSKCLFCIMDNKQATPQVTCYGIGKYALQYILSVQNNDIEKKTESKQNLCLYPLLLLSIFCKQNANYIDLVRHFFDLYFEEYIKKYGDQTGHDPVHCTGYSDKCHAKKMIDGAIKAFVL